MRSVLHLYIFVEEDILEIEFSSNKTSPDVAQGFIKLKLRYDNPLYQHRDKLGSLWFRAPTGYLPEINHRAHHRTSQVQLAFILTPLSGTHTHTPVVYKNLHVRLDRWPFQPSMTEDSAIRIVLHSEEVVHFHNTKQVTAGDHPTDCQTTTRPTSGRQSRLFTMSILIRRYLFNQVASPRHRLILLIGIRPPRQGT